MTAFVEMGRAMEHIAEAANNSWDAMSEQQLLTMAQGMGFACAASGAFLISRSGDDPERARVHVARAHELPAKVLKRRAREFETVMEGDKLPNIPQHAAWIAYMQMELQNIAARIERKRAGAALN